MLGSSAIRRVGNMSKIYDALIKLEKKRRTRPKADFSPSSGNDRIVRLNFWLENISLERKVIGAVAGMTLAFGILFLVVVNQLMGRALRTQIDQRALVMTTNLSDAAAGHVMANNILELHALVTKYARMDGSAYAFIEDNKGKVVAHTLPLFPPELAETLSMNERRQLHRRVIRLQGKTVYETRTPILEGQVGSAHIGIWGENVAREIYRAMLPMVGLLAGLFLGAVILSGLLARQAIRWLTAMESQRSAEDPDTSVALRLTE